MKIPDTVAYIPAFFFKHPEETVPQKVAPFLKLHDSKYR